MEVMSPQDQQKVEGSDTSSSTYLGQSPEKRDQKPDTFELSREQWESLAAKVDRIEPALTVEIAAQLVGVYTHFEHLLKHGVEEKPSLVSKCGQKVAHLESSLARMIGQLGGEVTRLKGVLARRPEPTTTHICKEVSTPADDILTTGGSNPHFSEKDLAAPSAVTNLTTWILIALLGLSFINLCLIAVMICLGPGFGHLCVRSA